MGGLVNHQTTAQYIYERFFYCLVFTVALVWWFGAELLMVIAGRPEHQT